MAFAQHGTVTKKIGDTTHVASYTVERGIITVSSEHGHSKTRLGATPAEVLARMILGEHLSKARVSREPDGE